MALVALLLLAAAAVCPRVLCCQHVRLDKNHYQAARPQFPGRER